MPAYGLRILFSISSRTRERNAYTFCLQPNKLTKFKKGLIFFVLMFLNAYSFTNF
jgi:hypothetical protein